MSPLTLSEADPDSLDYTCNRCKNLLIKDIEEKIENVEETFENLHYILHLKCIHKYNTTNNTTLTFLYLLKAKIENKSLFEI